jgi:folate-binding protein YgfZ
MTFIFKPAQTPIHWTWLTLTGPDAQDFLHRVTTAHVRALSPGQGAPGCFLTAQGKIRAYFTLWNFDQNAYAFEFDAGATGKWKQDLLAAIDQFTFAENITVTDPGEQLSSLWIFPNDEDLSKLSKLGIENLEVGHTIAVDEEIRISHHGNKDYGRTWFTCWGRPSRLNQWMDQIVNQALPHAKEAQLTELENWRVQALSPRVDSEITESVLPLEINLREAIAPNKGCYPGQEVIEKIISLGSPPKRLARIEGKGTPPSPGEIIFNVAEPPAEVGQVTSVSASGDSFQALGLVRKIHAKEGLEVQFSPSAKSKGAIVQVAPYA